MSDQSQRLCPTCGARVAPGAAVCAHCGMPLDVAPTAPAAPVPPSAEAAQPSIAPAIPTALAMPTAPLAGAGASALETLPSAPPPLPPGSESAPPTAGGIAGLAYSASPTPTTPAEDNKRARKRTIAIVSALCIVALLIGAGIGIFAYLNAHTETDAAAYLPANTLAFASVDLVALAKNHPQYSRDHLFGTSTGTDGSTTGQLFQQATGLDPQSDILPWLGRDIAFAEFATGPAQTDAFGDQSIPTSYVVLIQSRDDDAASAALVKFVRFQGAHGIGTTATATYGGVRLTTLTDMTGQASLCVGAHAGWAFIAGSPAAAHIIVDLMNGKGEPLAHYSTFLHATARLASNRFATLYLNLNGINALSATGSSGTSTLPLFSTYPLALGDLIWTNLGLRAEVTLPSAPQSIAPNLTGDTTSLARLVPANASVYAGYANLGGALQEIEGLSGGSEDMGHDLLGITSSDPMLQQPGALVMLSGTQGEFPTESDNILLSEPDAASAQQVVHQLTTSMGFTDKVVKIGGASADALYAKVPGSFLGNAYGINLDTPGGPAPKGPYLVAYTTYVGSTLVIAPTQDALSSILATASGSAPSLAESQSFQQLLAQAPHNAMGTAYTNPSALLSSVLPGTVPGAPGAPSAGGTTGNQAAGGILVTQQLDATELKVTIDAAVGN